MYDSSIVVWKYVRPDDSVRATVAHQGQEQGLLTFKVKAKVMDLSLKSKDLSFKTKIKNLTFKVNAKDKAKDLSFKAKIRN